jgi:hypothetical protein
MRLGAWLVLSGILLIPGETRADGLTRSEQKRVLTAIESDCADTWCEGDFDFKFDSIRCQFERRLCRLGFRAGRRPVEAGRIRFTIRTHCILNGIAGPSDILSTAGGHEALKEPAYEQINECIDYRLREADPAAFPGGS